MRSWLDTLVLTLLVGVACACLRQDAVHHLDMHGVVRSVAAPPGEGARYGHFGYQWLAHLLHAALGPAAPLYRPLQWCSVLGVALAAAAGHRACLAIGLDRARAGLATAGAVSTTAVLHFATVAEIHAVFWLPVNLAWWALARCVRNASVWRAARLGALTAVAAAVHSSGHLLPLLVLLAFGAARLPPRLGGARVVAMVLTVFGSHLLATAVLHAVDRAWIGGADAAAAEGFLAETLARWQGLGALGGIAWREWLRPYAPFSVLFLAVLLRRELRPAVLAVALAVGGYLAVDLALLIGLVEHGAYALPLALPVAALAAAGLRPVGMLAATVAAAAIAVPHVLRQDPARVAEPAFAQGLLAWRAAHPGSTFVLGGYAEIDSMLVFGAPAWHHTILEPEFVVWLEPDRSESFVRERLLARVRRAAAAGGAFVFSREAAALFQSLPRNAALLGSLGRDVVVEPVVEGAFRGLAIRARG